MPHFARTSIWSALLIAPALFVGTSNIHLMMTKSAPEADAVVTQPPEAIRVWFNQEPQLAVSALGLKGPAGEIELGKAEKTDDAKSFKASVPEGLPDGEYTVSWRTAGDDGHVERGTYVFTLRAAKR